MDKEINHVVLAGVLSVFYAFTASAAVGLDRLFDDPPESARLQVWYHWVQDRVTREGLAADVQAMAEAGISAAYVFTCQKKQSNLPSNVLTMSDEWLGLFDFFCEKAASAGVAVGFHNCPGWTSSGGPWIRPEDAMKELCFYFGDVNTNDCPQGFWREIARYTLPDGRRLTAGYRLLPGAVNRPASVSGLECDKLSKRGIEAHWAAMPAKILALPHAKAAVRYCVIDSNEQRGQTWTEELPAHFLRYCGYDPLPFLPVLAGCSVKDAAADARFRADFRRVICDMYAENYYGRFVELCHASGIKAVIEPYHGPFEYVRVGQLADVATAEYWIGHEERKYLYSSTWLISSAARLANGICASETFTTETRQGRFKATPHEFRIVGDRAWSEGVNQFVVHSYVHQPYLNVKPGVTLGNNGSMFNRNMTWWPEVPSWSGYVARSQALLQSGKPAKDILVLSGNEGVNVYDLPPGHPVNKKYPGIDLPAALADEGYSFDLCCARDLLGGDVSGYRAVWTPDPATLTDDLVSRIAQLKKAGVTVVHPPAAPGPEDTARAAGLKPVVAVRGKGKLRFVRRESEDGVVFYVYNAGTDRFSGSISLRGERWDAKSGEKTPFDGSLALAAGESAFIVTGRVCRAVAPVAATEAERMDLSTYWRVTFDGPGGPKEDVSFPRLVRWDLHADPSIRYFAGRARYSKRVAAAHAGRYRLDLGAAWDIAVVRVDGREIATRWEKPYVVEFTTGNASFDLDITIVNTWPNRMIGDAVARRDGAAEPRSPRGWPLWAEKDLPDSGSGIYTWAWTNFDFWKADEPLLPAGLEGPVTLIRLADGGVPREGC